jgi:hypothetical protein
MVGLAVFHWFFRSSRRTVTGIDFIRTSSINCPRACACSAAWRTEEEAESRVGEEEDD